MKTLKALSFVVVGALGLLFRAYWAGAQQAGLPPLPPGYMYQVIAKTNAGNALSVTAESVNLPPLPPGFVFGVAPEPTNTVEIIPELFEALPDESSTGVVSVEAGLKRHRSARLNRNWSSARSGKFILNLFADTTYTAVIERSEPVGSSLVRFCQLEGKPQSRLIIAEQNGVIACSLLLPGENSYAVRYDGVGHHKISELEMLSTPSKPQCVVNVQPEQLASDVSSIVESSAAGGANAGAGPPIIDIMVLYTPATSLAEGGLDGISSLIALAVSEVNVVFENSLVNAHLRLVHAQEVPYVESGDSDLQTDSDRLHDPSDGYLDVIPGPTGLGKAWGADLISLWVTHPNAATSRGDSLTLSTPVKYSVVIARYAASTGSPQRWHFAHELGHNLGCGHGRDDPNPPPMYHDYSFGYRQICADPCGSGGGAATDLMVLSGEVLPYYSNPQVFYNYPGIPDPCPLGVAPPSPCACDCAGTMNVTAPIVAAYETATFMSAPRFQNSNQDFVFDITGPANASCHIESSSDFINWTLKSTVTLSSQGLGTYTDTQAGSVPSRFYRIRPQL